MVYNTYKAILKRVDILGVNEPEIAIEDNNKIRIALAGIKNKEEASFLGQYKIVPEVQGFPSSNTVITKDDVLVIYGANQEIYKFLKKFNIQ